MSASAARAHRRSARDRPMAKAPLTTAVKEASRLERTTGSAVTCPGTSKVPGVGGRLARPTPGCAAHRPRATGRGRKTRVGSPARGRAGAAAAGGVPAVPFQTRAIIHPRRAGCCERRHSKSASAGARKPSPEHVRTRTWRSPRQSASAAATGTRCARCPAAAALRGRYGPTGHVRVGPAARSRVPRPAE